MGKLFKLKKWLTVPEAAQHLSIVFGEEVKEADVLRFALDGHLKLSVNFVNYAEARCGKVVPLEDARFHELSPLIRDLVLEMRKGKPTMVLDGLQISDSEVLELEKTMVSLNGVYDLPMIGNERLDVEHEYQNLTAGPAVTIEGFDGAFVKGQDGQLWQLQESFDDNEYQAGSKAQLRKLEGQIKRDDIDSSKAKELLGQHIEERKKFLEERKKKKESENYYPAGGLPQDSVLVVRTDALREFEQSINNAPASSDKPIATTERNTLLTIIAALCDYSAIDPAGRGAANQIAKLTEKLGATVTDDTIRKALAKIPDALEARTK